MDQATKAKELEVVQGLGRAMFLADYRAEHPDATPEMRQAAWQAKKAEYLGRARQVMARLEGQNLQLTTVS